MPEFDSPTFAQRLGRVIQTLRHYRTTQLIRRGWKVAKTRWAKTTGFVRRPPERNDLTIREFDAFAEMIEIKTASRQDRHLKQRVDTIRRGCFSFLNLELNLGRDIDWHARGYDDATQLWRFQLHYHEFLLDFIAAHQRWDEDKFIESAHFLVDHWIRQHPFGDPEFFDDAWHPFCISRRLPTWLVLFQYCPPQGEALERVLDSVFQQAWFLSQNLELDVRGNHLLENARALLLTASFFEGSDTLPWFELGRRIVRSELKTQLLDSGEHFERSPMYHNLMLEAFLDIALCCQDVDGTLAEECLDAATKMAGFLQTILHPDNEFPLFGDSCFGETASSRSVILRAAANGELVAPENTDYWSFRDGDNFLLFDRGKVAADYLPAHGHCDLLNFEASIGGQRFIVDTGVFGYDDDEMRRLCRSSAAHNVVEIDLANQCNVWSKFRMGARGKPIKSCDGQESEFEWSACSHNGYRRLGVPSVTRWLGCRTGGPWFIVDSVRGKREHTLVNRLHLHPECVAEQIDENLVSVERGQQLVQIRPLLAGNLSIEEGWYCPKFGERHSSPVVTWSTSTTLPLVFGWQIDFHDAHSPAKLVETESGQIQLLWESETGEIVLPLVM